MPSEETYRRTYHKVVTAIEAVDELVEICRLVYLEVPNEEDQRQLASCLNLLKSRTDEHLANLCYDMTYDDLDKMNLTSAGILGWKKTLPPSPVVSKDDTLWTEDMLYRHLQFLERVEPRETDARSWVNAFLYHIASSIPKDSHMVTGIEKDLPDPSPSDRSFHTLLGYDERMVLVTPSYGMAFVILTIPDQRRLQQLKPNESVLYIAESDGSENCVDTHIPQAIAEMSACARIAGQKTIRGVVTNGRRWLFLVLTLNSVEGDDGGTFWESDDRSVVINEVSKWDISRVCSILARWLLYSHSPLDSDDESYFDC
ncbi:hypothetical protein BJ165DRAFT_1527086 [Panaeolus papilionaceus]|nr:hypothetical protein BJ165DRAFT_1527086 [Panaeolus papilionaceus]